MFRCCRRRGPADATRGRDRWVMCDRRLDVSESHTAEIDRGPVGRGLYLGPLVRPGERIIHPLGMPSTPSASAAANVGCRTRHPPPASVAPSDITKLPDQKKPLADQQRRLSPGSNLHTRRKRHIWIVTPRCALRMPLGLLVEPDEKNNAPASLGRTASAVASTSSRGSSSDRGPGSRPSRRRRATRSPTIARSRRNGNFADCSAPGRALPISGASSDRHGQRSPSSTTCRSNSSSGDARTR